MQKIQERDDRTGIGRIAYVMRVITGSARGRNLETLKGADIIRPTSQKIKGTMFSAVQFFVPGAKVLDLYAGSGQLGIEALSRGSSSCVFVDVSREACGIITKNLKTTGLFKLAKVINSDGLSFAARTRDRFDLIFLDPPYGNDTVQRFIPVLANLLEPGGYALCETESDIELPKSEGKLVLKKQYRHGTTTVWSYHLPPDEELD